MLEDLPPVSVTQAGSNLKLFVVFVEFIAGSSVAPRVFLWDNVSGFLPATETSISKFQFHLGNR